MVEHGRNINQLEGLGMHGKSYGRVRKVDQGNNHWTEDRNEAKEKIYWTFAKQDADRKLFKYYVV